MQEPQSTRGRSAGSLKSHLIFGLIGFLTGLSFGRGEWAALTGLCLGLLFSHWSTSRDRIRRLEQTLDAVIDKQLELRRRVGDEPELEDDPSLSSPVAQATSQPGRERAEEEGAREDAGAQSPAESIPPSQPIQPSQPTSDDRSASGAPSLPPLPPREPSPIDGVIAAIRGFFFGGNTIVRTGLLVLLVGVTLLAKYAADNSLFPLEARLAVAAMTGLVLVVLGYRMRTARPGFGMSLQGGGIAALYVVTFFAFKVFGLVPAGLAFGIFVSLAIATAILSTLQASEALLVIGSLGGFLAPILASTGEGNHVALFGYYLLLIVSIAFVAWRKAWRWPAFVAFVCTYVVATTWGVLRYENANFSTVEPFVLAFMALFTGIAILHAWRRPPQLRGMVDGTLVFGTPLFSILFQNALVGDRELGLALSAAGFGLFYAACAVFLWRMAPVAVRPLAEAFIALAVGFATMAIPFAFEESLTTSIAWALEGAGLYWVGARQGRVFPRISGFALQLLAGLAFAISAGMDAVDSSGFVPIANGRALSCMALALAGMFIARRAFVSDEGVAGAPGVSEKRFAQLFGIWGLLWWTGGSFAEIDQFVAPDWRASACLLWIGFTAATLEWGAARSGWTPGRSMALASLPLTALLLIPILDEVPHLLAHGGWMTWPLVFAVFLRLWMRLDTSHDRLLLPFRAGGLWLLAFVSACALAGLADEGLGLAKDWAIGGFGLGLAATLWLSTSFLEGAWSPFDRETDSARRVGLGPIAVFSVCSILAFQFAARGNAAPLPHFPVFNPVDLVVWLLALSIWKWWRGLADAAVRPIDAARRQMALLAVLAVAFAALNGLLVRAVHQWGDVPFDADALWGASAMQVTLSIAWTLTGMIGMLLASRRGWRGAWMGCAGLLMVVVVKLFTVDLSQVSTLMRIGTFLAVGALLLVLGYVSPVPPGGAEEAEDETQPASPPSSAGRPAGAEEMP